MEMVVLLYREKEVDDLSPERSKISGKLLA